MKYQTFIREIGVTDMTLEADGEDELLDDAGTCCNSNIGCKNIN
ncbi:MAG: hypothetical protein ACLU4N_19935 [Butyricimonas faecihominis]